MDVHKIGEYVAESATYVAAGLEFLVILRLLKERKNLKKEIKNLANLRDAKSLHLVEQILDGLQLPICAVCKETLFLRLSTTFYGALKHIKSLAKAITCRPADMALVLDVLENAMNLNLWQPPLENPPSAESYRPKPDDEVVTYAMDAYVGLIPHMLDGERQRAIKFCVACCDKAVNNVTVRKREAVRTLLPRLLVESGGERELTNAYKGLFEDLRSTNIEAHKTLLVAVFGGLEYAVRVKAKQENSAEVKSIWEEAFNITIENVAWAWEGEGAKIGIIWYQTMVERLSLSDEDEREHLRRVVVRYLLTKDAPLHRISYRQLAHFVGNDLRSREPKGVGFRRINRAVVPKDLHIPVEIRIRGDASEAVMRARLINFSLDDSGGKLEGHGAWATAEVNKAWPQSGDWREASVVIAMPQTKPIVFDQQAKVKGPILEGAGDNSYYGFRIQLGPASPEDSIGPLRGPWTEWPKR